MRASIRGMRPLLFALLLAGCAARPVNTFTTIPKDTTNVCTSLCDSIGLHLTSVVVVASEVGCVCETPASAGKPAGASAAAGGAVIAVRAAERQRQQSAAQPNARR